MKVAHFDRLRGAVGAGVEGSAWKMFRCILILSRVYMFVGDVVAVCYM